MKPLAILRMGSTFAELARIHRDFVDWIAAGTGLPADQLTFIDAEGGAPLPAPDRMRGAILTGSHHWVTAGEPWSESVAAWLREAFYQKLPLLGICYGHQLIARALGGQVDFNPAGLEFGTVEITLAPGGSPAGVSPAGATSAGNSCDPLIGILEPGVHAHTCHAQTVRQLPPGATLLAASARDAHQAFRVGECCWGVQFHPEFDETAARYYIDQYQAPLTEQGHDPKKLIADLKPTPGSKGLLAAFASLTDPAASP